MGSVWYNACGNSLERRDAAGWDVVWVQVCALSTSALVGGASLGTEIAPGTALTTDVQVMTSLDAGWSQPLSGDYRLSAGLFTERDAVAAESRASAPFQFVIEVH